MAADLLELYDEAEEAGIDVAWFPLCEDRSMALQLNDGSCAIAIDPWKMYTLADETSCLGHELGHCKSGSFYNPYASSISEKAREPRRQVGHPAAHPLVGTRCGQGRRPY